MLSQRFPDGRRYRRRILPTRPSEFVKFMIHTSSICAVLARRFWSGAVVIVRSCQQRWVYLPANRIMTVSLRRVSLGGFDESVVAEQGGGEGGEGLEMLGFTVVAADQTAIAQ